MSDLALPSHMLGKEEYSVLPALEKEEYIDNVIKEILKLNPQGVTISDIDKSTYFGHVTIWHHLELMASRAECIKMERDDIDVYYTNKVVLSFPEIELKGKILGSRLSFDAVENLFGKFLRIQRHIEDSRSSAHKVRNGIIFPSDSIDEFIKTLTHIKSRLNKK